MDKRTGGLLLGAAAGLTLVWDFFGRDQRDVDLYIVLEPSADGGCRVATKPAYAELHLNQAVNWHITNNWNRDVGVSLEAWRNRRGRRVHRAARSNNPHATGLRADVPAHGSGSIDAKARFGLFEICIYDVYLDGSLGADPIVKLTP